MPHIPKILVDATDVGSERRIGDLHVTIIGPRTPQSLAASICRHELLPGRPEEGYNIFGCITLHALLRAVGNFIVLAPTGRKTSGVRLRLGHSIIEALWASAFMVVELGSIFGSLWQRSTRLMSLSTLPGPRRGRKSSMATAPRRMRGRMRLTSMGGQPVPAQGASRKWGTPANEAFESCTRRGYIRYGACRYKRAVARSTRHNQDRKQEAKRTLAEVSSSQPPAARHRAFRIADRSPWENPAMNRSRLT